jgi:hypothetical protein
MMSPRHNPVRAATIAALARPLDLRGLNLATLHGVMAVRLCALFDHAQREPLAELAQRFRSFEAAEAVLALVREVVRAWPEPFVTSRPCCLALSPDEATLAAMLRCAGRGERGGFGEALAGFVRADRHERLYDASVRAAALLEAANA